MIRPGMSQSGRMSIQSRITSKAMKEAIRSVRSTGQVSKPMIRAIVIAVCSALSRAADDEADDDNR